MRFTAIFFSQAHLPWRKIAKTLWGAAHRSETPWEQNFARGKILTPAHRSIRAQLNHDNGNGQAVNRVFSWRRIFREGTELARTRENAITFSSYSHKNSWRSTLNNKSKCAQSRYTLITPPTACWHARWQCLDAQRARVNMPEGRFLTLAQTKPSGIYLS